jgi:monothiol glutaredoxin
MTDTHAFIDNMVKTNDVVLFMKGSARMPQCGFSGTVVKILDHVGVDFQDVNILASDDMRQGIKDYSNRSPALYQGRVCWRLRHCARNV